MFIVGAGVLSMVRNHGGATIEFERLGPGDHYGEIGMLTGAASIVSITAVTPAVVY